MRVRIAGKTVLGYIINIVYHMCVYETWRMGGGLYVSVYDACLTFGIGAGRR